MVAFGKPVDKIEEWKEDKTSEEKSLTEVWKMGDEREINDISDDDDTNEDNIWSRDEVTGIIVADGYIVATRELFPDSSLSAVDWRVDVAVVLNRIGVDFVSAVKDVAREVDGWISNNELLLRVVLEFKSP